MRVLGIDPSLQSTGYGIIDYADNTYTVLSSGVIRPSSRQLFHHKINEIRARLEELIQTHKPDEVAIENPFYARNIKTAISLGQVRGAALVAVASRGCELHEYSPLEIKKAVTGYGQADKNQVRAMVRTLLHIEDEELTTDASDALAAAFCHINTRIFQQKLKNSVKERKGGG